MKERFEPNTEAVVDTMEKIPEQIKATTKAFEDIIRNLPGNTKALAIAKKPFDKSSYCLKYHYAKDPKNEGIRCKVDKNNLL